MTLRRLHAVTGGIQDIIQSLRDGVTSLTKLSGVSGFGSDQLAEVDALLGALKHGAVDLAVGKQSHPNVRRTCFSAESVRLLPCGLSFRVTGGTDS